MEESSPYGSVCGGFSEWLGPTPYEPPTKRELEALQLIDEHGGMIPWSGISGQIKRRLKRARFPWGAPLIEQNGPLAVLTRRGREILEIESEGRAWYDEASHRWVPVSQAPEDVQKEWPGGY